MTWRPRPASRVGLVVFALGELAFAAWLIRAAALDDALLAGVAFACFAAVGPAVIALRYAFRARIVAKDDVLVVIGCLSERKIPWSDVVGADAGYSGITVHLRDGSSVVAGAVQKATYPLGLAAVLVPMRSPALSGSEHYLRRRPKSRCRFVSVRPGTAAGSIAGARGYRSVAQRPPTLVTDYPHIKRN